MPDAPYKLPGNHDSRTTSPSSSEYSCDSDAPAQHICRSYPLGAHSRRRNRRTKTISEHTHLPRSNAPSATDQNQHEQPARSPSFPSEQPRALHLSDIHVPSVIMEPSRPLNVAKSKSGRDNAPLPPAAMQSPIEPPSKRNDTSYLNYQPGLHATAGPLPPPPRATFAIDSSHPPPPRPPRMQTPNPRSRGDMEAVKQALQLPPSVSAVLASRSSHVVSSSSSSKVDSAKLSSIETPPSVELEPVKTLLRREGAFIHSPDPANAQNSSSKQKDDVTHEPQESAPSNDHVSSSACSNIVIVTPPPRLESLQTSHSQGKLPVREVTTPPEVFVERPLSPDISSTAPPKSFRNSITNGLKRLSSISRSPSLSSRSPKRTSIGTTQSSRTPSPPYPYQDPMGAVRPRRAKIVTLNPAALFCHEVYTTKSTAERCSIYIQKINELYNCDTGLMDWLDDAKNRGSNAANIVPSSPTDPFTPQRRHTSGSSMMTDATFPLRPDAATATDLTSSHRNTTPPSAQPPSLPYPSLAITQQPQRLAQSVSGAGSISSSSSIRSPASSAPSNPLKGGFFASLGRRTSVSGRREKHGITALSPTNSQNGGSGKNANVLTKAPPQQQPSPRPVNIVTSPSVPGGPRAPPNRVKRSQTLTTTPVPFSTKSEVEPTNTLGQPPATHDLSQDGVIDIRPDPDFSRQVDRLADLLPHADRDILSVYLRRAGQDILAIGLYLEDEKNGTLRHD
ncbi:hypothetical protein APHAL10511_002101 [Amanita phalloides]|nr:hypothetical protein APHAL10511_002101 [Amanita phalloides]